MEFAKLEPFDETRADIRSADEIAALYNLHRDKEARPEAYTHRDFLLRFGDDAPEKQSLVKKTWQQMKAAGRAIFEGK